MPLAILVGSRLAAPTLASGRPSRPRSRREPGHAASVRRVYSCTHRRSLGKSDSVDRRAPISSSLAPRPNPHSVRGTAATDLPRFRALALLGRRPPQRVDDLVIPASEKPAQQRTHAPQQLYSITSSARSRKDSGIFSPSALAVFRLITSGYLVGNCTGSSPTFAPRRMRST